MQQLTPGERVDIRHLFGPAGLDTLDLHLSRAPDGLRLWVTATQDSGAAGQPGPGPSSTSPSSTSPSPTNPSSVSPSSVSPGPDLAAPRGSDARIRLGYALPAGITHLTVGCSWRGPHAWNGTLSLAGGGTLHASVDLGAPAVPGAPDLPRSMLLVELYLHERRWRLRVRGEETRGGPAGAARLLGVPEAQLRPDPLPTPPAPAPAAPPPAAPPPAAPARPVVRPSVRPAAPVPPAPPVTAPPPPAAPPSPAPPTPDANDSVLGRFQKAWHALLGLPADPAPGATQAAPDTRRTRPDAQAGAVTRRTLQDLKRRLDLTAQDLKPGADGLDANAARLRVRHAQLLETHGRIEREARDLEDQRGRLRALNLLDAQETELRAVENEIERAVQALQTATDDLATELVSGRLLDSRARLGAEDRYLRGLGTQGDRSLGDLTGRPASPTPATPVTPPPTTLTSPTAAPSTPTPDGSHPAPRVTLTPPGNPPPGRPDPTPDTPPGRDDAPGENDGGLVIPWLNRR
ncbi:hypothetical protein [Deinococcus knuensis]|uniref:Uncharacterized protein n=1 Tax=Deinococcus knuensis TaxID=1837380 RepID=A0ABQ2SW44_9DEIO|nr:hypothetical protein [Deinococcus knuensis]GGS39942.1 hypothetical protein GCM10008961_34150 [Deinococcus knuensis]